MKLDTIIIFGFLFGLFLDTNAQIQVNLGDDLSPGELHEIVWTVGCDATVTSVSYDDGVGFIPLILYPLLENNPVANLIQESIFLQEGSLFYLYVPCDYLPPEQVSFNFDEDACSNAMADSGSPMDVQEYDFTPGTINTWANFCFTGQQYQISVDIPSEDIDEYDFAIINEDGYGNSDDDITNDFVNTNVVVVSSNNGVSVTWDNTDDNETLNQRLRITPKHNLSIGGFCEGPSFYSDLIVVYKPEEPDVDGPFEDFCGLTSQTYFVEPDSYDIDVIRYEWQTPDGVNITSYNNDGISQSGINVSFDLYPAPGTIIATPVYAGPGNLFGPFSSNETFIPIDDYDFVQTDPYPAPPGNITGPLVFCEGSSIAPHYFLDPVPNANGVIWYLYQDGIEVMSFNDANDLGFEISSISAGQYTIVAAPYNDCGDGPTGDVDILVQSYSSNQPDPVFSASYDYTDILNLTLDNPLLINQCSDISSCINYSHSSAEINVKFDVGEDYTFGEAVWEENLTLKITAYADYTNDIVVFEEQKDFKINTMRPEQLYNIDVSDIYTNVFRIEFEVINFENAADDIDISNDLRLLTWVDVKQIMDVGNEESMVNILPHTLLNEGQVLFNWEFTPCDLIDIEAPNYEFQLLRLYHKNEWNDAEEGYDVDWSEALTIETQSSNTSLVLTIAEGTGYYVWRVRPIGNYYSGGIANENNWGQWSEHSGFDQSTTINATFPPTSNYCSLFNTFNEDSNWIFDRTFVEGDFRNDQEVKISEGVTFANGLQQVTQTQRHLATENYLIATQSVYDYSGRATLQSIPVPIIDKDHLGYESALLKNNLGNIFSASDFDTNINYLNPAEIKDDVNEHFSYYSDDNPNVDIPTAEGFPYVRTLYYAGGTRVKEQGGVGLTLGLKNDPNISHTVKTYYSGVSDTELIRVFGDEAPLGEASGKVVTVDANNTASITYLGKDGKTWATCLAVNGANTLGDNTEALDGLGSQNGAEFEVYEVLANSTSFGEYGSMNSTTQTFVIPTTVTVGYDITPAMIDGFCTSAEFCATCDYYIEIEIVNIEEPAVSVGGIISFVIPGSNLCSPTTFDEYTTDVSLDAGTYVFTQTITTNIDVPLSEPNQSYLAQHIITLSQDLTAEAQAEFDPYLVYLTGNEIDLIGFYEALNVVFDADGIPNVETVTLTLSCGEIDIPVEICPPPISCVNLETTFVDLFKENWPYDYDIDEFPDDPPFYMDFYNGTSLQLGDYSEDLFTQLIENMKLEIDGYEYIYDCNELYYHWYSVVISLEETYMMYMSNINPDNMDELYDPVGMFLNNAGLHYQGATVVNTDGPYDELVLGDNNDPNDINEAHYLTNAYAYFPLPEPPNDPSETDAYPTCISIANQMIGEPENSGSTGWSNLSFPFSYEDFEFNNEEDIWTFVANCCSGIEQAEEMEFDSNNALAGVSNGLNLCHEQCDAREDGFIRTLLNLYHSEDTYINDYDSSNDFDEWYTTPNPFFSNPPEYEYNFDAPIDWNNLETGISEVSIDDFNCQIEALLSYCHSHCQVTAIDNDPADGIIDSYGTDEEAIAMGHVMTHGFELAFPTTGGPTGGLECQEDFELVATYDNTNPYSSQLPNELEMTGVLNDALNDFTNWVYDGAGSNSSEYNWVFNGTYSTINFNEFTNTNLNCDINLIVEIKEVHGTSINNVFGLSIDPSLISSSSSGISKAYMISRVAIVSNLSTILLDISTLNYFTSFTLFNNSTFDYYENATTLCIFDVIENNGNGFTDTFGEFTFENFNDIGFNYIDPSPYQEVTCDFLTASCTSSWIYDSLFSNCGITNDPLNCPELCIRWFLPEYEAEEVLLTCEEMLVQDILTSFEAGIYDYVTENIDLFESEYMEDCANPLNIDDICWISYPLAYHHYTLYYYDRAGNLMKTVPPKGVDILTSSEITSVLDFRETNQGTSILPDHTLFTEYYYNSLGQLIRQETPDGGESYFYYDKIGQLRFSQNAQQLEDDTYAYTKYDKLARPIDVGLASNASAMLSTPSLHANDEFWPNEALTSQKTKTVYSEPAIDITYHGKTQRYLQNRVSFVYNDDGSSTYYSYDVHGNVEWLIQDVPGIGKQYLEYKYDLVSGNVLEVAYNKGARDQFYHRYAYDSDNRLITTETSVDHKIWDNDATYEYMLHGPLNRTEVGEDLVQGLDKTYTIHGWLKGVNHPDFSLDPQQDGTSGSAVAKDVFGMTLGYFSGDFNRTASNFKSNVNNTSGYINASNLSGNERNLYNGNISSWTTRTGVEETLGNLGYWEDKIKGYYYRYDELNRIQEANFAEFNTDWVASNSYSTSYDYDANGNISKLNRNANGIGMDQMEYGYRPNTNQLLHVDDAIVSNDPFAGEFIDHSGSYGWDDEIDYYLDGYNDTDFNAGNYNYKYNKIGQLIQDKAEGIENIEWTISGKIAKIERDPAFLIPVPDSNPIEYISRPDLEFVYDAMGNRVVKIVKHRTDVVPTEIMEEDKWEYFYYVHDASGTTMANYEKKYEDFSGGDGYYENVYLKEQPIYGSSRLGSRAANKLVSSVENPIGDLAFETQLETLTHESEAVNFPLCLDNGTDAQPMLIENFSTNNFLSGYTTAEPGKNTSAAEIYGGMSLFFNTYPNGGSYRSVIYNSNGDIIYNGQELISNPNGQSIIMKKPGVNKKYYIFTVSEDGIPYYHVVDLLNGVGVVENMNYPLDSQSGYFQNMALIEDHTGTNSKLFLSKYTGTKHQVIAVEITNNGFLPAELFYEFPFPTISTKSDFQISTSGDKLAYCIDANLFVHSLTINHEMHETVSYILTENMVSIDYSPLNKYLYGVNTSQKLYRFSLNTQILSFVKDDVSEIRRGYGGAMYGVDLSMPTTSLDKISDPEGATVSIGSYILPMNFSGNLPLQPHKIFAENYRIYTRNIQQKNYEINDHLGNVRAVISDMKIPFDSEDDGVTDYYVSDLVSANNYYPFGMTQPGRSFSSPSYRYGFNGMEKDDEIKGKENSYDFGARMYDPRIGRWFATDILFSKYPSITPYGFVANSPLINREINGEDFIVSINHETKRITITSSIYVKKGDANAKNRALKAAEFWNSKSGKFQYRVGKGKKAVYYDIDIVIEVNESLRPQEEPINVTKHEDYTTGEVSESTSGTLGANSFETLPTEDFDDMKKIHNSDPQAGGVTIGGKHVVVPKAQKMGFGTQETIDIHELGHTLGMLHFPGTAMHFATSGGRQTMTIPMMQSILGVSGITNNYFEDATHNVQTKVTTEGDKPSNFEEGQVTKTKRK